MDTQAAGNIIGGIIPAFVFGGYGAMQKQCVRAGLGIEVFFIVLGTTVACSGLAIRFCVGGGFLTLKGVFFTVGFASFWSLATGMILLSVGRYGASIGQLAPLYNSSTLVTVLLSLWLLAEWREVSAFPLLLGAGVVVAGAVVVTFATREAPHESSGGSHSFRLRNWKGLLVGGFLPALALGLTGPLMKGAMRAGLGIGEFLILFGITLTLVGVSCLAVTRRRAIPRAGLRTGIITGVLWSIGTGLNLVALDRLNASISQLTPLFNMNTLVVVLLGLWLFREDRYVRPVPLVAGALLIVLGGVLVVSA